LMDRRTRRLTRAEKRFLRIMADCIARLPYVVVGRQDGLHPLLDMIERKEPDEHRNSGDQHGG
jgi:hypothetical protein